MVRGRKSWNKSSGKIRKELLNKLYNSYKKQYNQKSSKGYAMKAKLSKHIFADVYNEYRNHKKNPINQNVVRQIVTDQRVVSFRQASALNSKAKEIEKMLGFTTKASDFRSNNNIAKSFWNYVNSHGGFRKVFYDEDEDE